MSVDWNILPAFIQEGVLDFPFSNNTEAQEFMDVLASWSWFTVGSRPADNCSMEEVLHYSAGIREEWVSELMGNDRYSRGWKQGRVQVGNSWGNVIWTGSRLQFQSFTSKCMIFSSRRKTPWDLSKRSEEWIWTALKNILVLLVGMESSGIRYPGPRSGWWVWNKCSRLTEDLWVIIFLWKRISNWNQPMVILEACSWWQHKMPSWAPTGNVVRYDISL